MNLRRVCPQAGEQAGGGGVSDTHVANANAAGGRSGGREGGRVRIRAVRGAGGEKKGRSERVRDGRT